MAALVGMGSTYLRSKFEIADFEAFENYILKKEI